jgi:hypothetical protein
MTPVLGSKGPVRCLRRHRKNWVLSAKLARSERQAGTHASRSDELALNIIGHIFLFCLFSDFAVQFLLLSKWLSDRQVPLAFSSLPGGFLLGVPVLKQILVSEHNVVLINADRLSQLSNPENNSIPESNSREQ